MIAGVSLFVRDGLEWVTTPLSCLGSWGGWVILFWGGEDLGGGGPMKLVTATAVPKGRSTFAAMVMLNVLIWGAGE